LVRNDNVGARWVDLQACGEEFVALDAGGNAAAAIQRVDAQDATVTTDVDIACKRNLLRQGENKFDRAAHFRRGFAEEVKAAVTDVARMTIFFDHAIAIGITHTNRQHHRKSTRGPSLLTLCCGFGGHNEANLSPLPRRAQ